MTIINTLCNEDKIQEVIAEKAGWSQSAVWKHINGELSERENCDRKRRTSNRDDMDMR